MSELGDKLFPPKEKRVPERTQRWVELRVTDDTGKSFAIRTVGYPLEFVEQKEHIKQQVKDSLVKILDKLMGN